MNFPRILYFFIALLIDLLIDLLKDRERIKGNESFKAKEYETAFDCYSRSLALLELAPTYSNRAMTAIKLERYEVAIDDCSRALDIDPSFTKALIRRGMARTCIGQLGPAIEDFSAALERESGNLDLAKMLDKAKAKFEDVEGRPFGTPRVVPSSSTTPQEGRIVQLQSRPEEAFLRGYELVTSGKCNVAKTPLSEPSPPPAETFTRIQISQDEESDEDEEEEEENAGAEDDKESLDERRLDAVSVPSSPAVGPFDQLIAEIDRLETAHSLGDALKLIESSLSDAAVSLSSAQREDLQRKQLSLLASLGRHKDVISLCNQVLDGDRTLLWAYIQRAEAHKAMVLRSILTCFIFQKPLIGPS